MPPFRLGKQSEGDLTAAVYSIAQRHYPMSIGRLEIDYCDDLIMLRARHHEPLEAFWLACRDEFAPFRMTDPTIDSGSIKREALNSSSGFHLRMTLAGPVPAAMADLTKHFTQAFEELARDEVEVGSISLMRQDDPARRYRVLMSTRLTGR